MNEPDSTHPDPGVSERQRCSMPVQGPSDWARAKSHDGRCSRWATDGEYCKQHAAAKRRLDALTTPTPDEENDE